MKSLEEDYKAIRIDYGQKISNHYKNKLEKCLSIARDLSKFQLIGSSGSGKNGDDGAIAAIRGQLVRIRGEIEGECKMGMTDYQAYLWKLEKIVHRAKPTLFEHLTISDENQTEYSTENLKSSLNFPILSHKIKDLIKLGADLMLENKYCSELFTQSTLTKLLTQISYSYGILPYHNFTHAFSLFMMLVQCTHISLGLQHTFGEFQILIAYIAALCHDMGHKGTNSFYEIKRKSQMAVMYNYESVLENMHISQFYRLCKEHPDVDLIAKIKSPVQRESAKRLFNRLILATDVQGHEKNLKKLQALPKKDPIQLSISQKQTILQNLFHACDVGNPCLSFPNYLNWSLLICQQFNQQVQKQRTQQLELSASMEFVDLGTHYRRQIGFIDFLVMPVWKQLSGLFVELEELRKQIQVNRSKLVELASEAKESI